MKNVRNKDLEEEGDGVTYRRKCGRVKGWGCADAWKEAGRGERRAAREHADLTTRPC